MKRTTSLAIVFAAIAALTSILTYSGIRFAHEEAKHLAEQRAQIEEAEKQIAALKADVLYGPAEEDGGRSRKLGTFVPLVPGGIGPLYGNQGIPSVGSGSFGSHTSGAEPIFEPTCVGPGTKVVWTSTPLVNGEGYDLDINAQLVTDAGGVWSHCRREWHGTNVNGVFEWADGGLTDIPTLTDFGGALVTASCQITWDAGATGQLPTLSLNVTSDAGTCVVPGLSNQRALPPLWAPLSIDQAVPTSLSPTVASPTVVQFLGTNDILPATVSSIRVAGATNNVTLTSLLACNSGANTNCVQGTFPAGTYTAETDTATITTAAGVFTFPFTIANVSPSITGIYVTTAGATPGLAVGPQEGGQGVTITGTNMGSSTAYSFGGSNCTGLSCGSTSCTCTTPAGPSVAGGIVTVTASPGGSTTSYGYFPSTMVAELYSDIGVTGSPVSAWADSVTPSPTLTLSQSTGGAQPTITSNYVNTFPGLTTDTSKFMRTTGNWSGVSSTNKFSWCGVFNMTTASTGFLATLSDSPLTDTNTAYVGHNGSTAIFSAFEFSASTVQNGGNTASTPMTSAHLWCATFDHTIGASIGVAAYEDGTFVSFSSTGTSAQNSANFTAAHVGLWTASGGAGAAGIAGSMAAEWFFAKLLSSTEVSNIHTIVKAARTAGGVGYAALP